MRCWRTLYSCYNNVKLKLSMVKGSSIPRMMRHLCKFDSRKFTRHDNPIHSKCRPFIVCCSTNNGPLRNGLGCLLYEESFKMAAMGVLVSMHV